MSNSAVSTILRVRRKRNAPVEEHWVVSSKRSRCDDGDAGASAIVPALFKLTATADRPSLSAAFTDVNVPSHVAVVEYDSVKGTHNAPVVVDKATAQLEEAMDLVERMDVSDPSNLKTEAPLASNESLNEEAYVYDFYATENPIDHNMFAAPECEIRQLSDADRDLFYFVDDSTDDADEVESIDSNDERNAVNDYPDEDENDTTSDDDYDHYGDFDDCFEDYLEMD